MPVLMFFAVISGIREGTEGGQRAEPTSEMCRRRRQVEIGSPTLHWPNTHASLGPVSPGKVFGGFWSPIKLYSLCHLKDIPHWEEVDAGICVPNPLWYIPPFSQLPQQRQAWRCFLLNLSSRPRPSPWHFSPSAGACVCDSLVSHVRSPGLLGGDRQLGFFHISLNPKPRTRQRAAPDAPEESGSLCWAGTVLGDVPPRSPGCISHRTKANPRESREIAASCAPGLFWPGGGQSEPWLAQQGTDRKAISPPPNLLLSQKGHPDSEWSRELLGRKPNCDPLCSQAGRLRAWRESHLNPGVPSGRPSTSQSCG